MNTLWKIQFMISAIIQWGYSHKNLNSKKLTPLHIIFCLVDHFEPGIYQETPEIENERMAELLSKYPEIARKHHDSNGTVPRRTWFFPPHYHRNNNLKKLVSLCEKGYGDIELHLHHGKTQPDTRDNLRATLLQCVKEYGEFGIFGSQNGARKYGFIHGDWALDNSLGGRYCGVNDEISVLRSTGCYADFTFPSLCESNPRRVNSIHYAVDDPGKPKSYDTGPRVSKGGRENGGLMIIQGPVHPFFFQNKINGLRVPGDAINGVPPVTNKRVDYWLNSHIHVKGKSDWIFVKTHTHGATDNKAVLGKEIDDIFSYLERNYNDGKHYILHYVTAREMYNIIKAAENDEKNVTPAELKEYLIKKPAYNSSVDIPEASDILKQMVYKTYKA